MCLSLCKLLFFGHNFIENDLPVAQPTVPYKNPSL